MSALLLKRKLLGDSRPQFGRLLIRHALWDAEGRTLWFDLSPFDARLEPVGIPSWDQWLTWQDAEPELPQWPLLHWPDTPALTQWKRTLPDWVIETLMHLPGQQQLRLLYLCARHPQMLELLDRMPLLAWRIATHPIDENRLRQLFPQPRTRLAQSVGWPARREAIAFLQKLRLRQVTPQLLQHVEHCLNQTETLAATCQLSRINSMALTLAARFPSLIASPLHQSLARQPCQPRQCERLQAVLEDTLTVCHFLQEDEALIGRQRFMIDVEALYARWFQTALTQWQHSHEAASCPPSAVPSPNALPVPWQRLERSTRLSHISRQTRSPWFLLADTHLILWHPEEEVAVALHRQADRWQINRARNTAHSPLSPAQHTALQLLLASLNA